MSNGQMQYIESVCVYVSVSVSGKCVCASVRVCSNQAIMILAWRALDIYTYLQDPKALDGLLYLTLQELLCNLGPFVRPTQSRRRTSSFWPGESKSQGLRLPQADSWTRPTAAWLVDEKSFIMASAAIGQRG